MAIKPILFNTEMVQAILNSRKSCTRRIVKPKQLASMLPDKCKNGVPEEFLKEKKLMFKPYCDMTDVELINTVYKAPYQPGDILYVRETWHKYNKRVGKGKSCHMEEFYGYKASIANSEDANEPWKPSIHMPKEAARIWLKVTGVRMEQLQEISAEGALAEGADKTATQDIESNARTGYGAYCSCICRLCTYCVCRTTPRNTIQTFGMGRIR